jgi:hypothetical protein
MARSDTTTCDEYASFLAQYEGTRGSLPATRKRP